jgi:beta-aspartyl-dipeptidase (metallo-type)
MHTPLSESDAGARFKIVRGGEVFGPQPLGRKEILICGERILDIGDEFEPKARALGTVEVIDARGRSVVPGFIDQHCHFLGGGDFVGPQGRVPELHASWVTTGGVTTAVGLLGVDMEFKGLHGLIVKARELDRVGLSTYVFTGSFEVPSPFLTHSVRADIILIDKVIGVKVALADDKYPNLSREELAKLAGQLLLAASISGKCAVMHCHTGRNSRGLRQLFDLLEAVNLPITQILPTHINRRLPDILEEGIRFAKMGGTIDFSAVMSRRSGSTNAYDPDQAVHKALEAGIPLRQITLSSDCNVSMPVLNLQDQPIGIRATSPGILHREWRHILRTNKLALADALPLVTSNVARVLKLDDRKGSLKPGMDADIVLLDDALSVDTVLCRGKLMVKGGEPVVKELFEEYDPSDVAF